MSQMLLDQGIQINIRRSDGRIHSAFVQDIVENFWFLAVEWEENQERKGKELFYEELLGINSDVVFFLPGSRLSINPYYNLPEPYTKINFYGNDKLCEIKGRKGKLGRPKLSSILARKQLCFSSLPAQKNINFGQKTEIQEVQSLYPTFPSSTSTLNISMENKEESLLDRERHHFIGMNCINRKPTIRFDEKAKGDTTPKNNAQLFFNFNFKPFYLHNKLNLLKKSKSLTELPSHFKFNELYSDEFDKYKKYQLLPNNDYREGRSDINLLNYVVNKSDRKDCQYHKTNDQESVLATSNLSEPASKPHSSREQVTEDNNYEDDFESEISDSFSLSPALEKREPLRTPGDSSPENRTTSSSSIEKGTFSEDSSKICSDSVGKEDRSHRLNIPSKHKKSNEGSLGSWGDNIFSPNINLKTKASSAPRSSSTHTGPRNLYDKLFYNKRNFPSLSKQQVSLRLKYLEMITKIRDNLRYGSFYVPPPDEERVKVYLRKRPLTKKEIDNFEIDVITVPQGNKIVLHEPKKSVDLTPFVKDHEFTFDYVFDCHCSNETVFNTVAKPLVKTIFERGRVLCLTYGQTGSGKSYTMGGKFIGKEQQIENGLYCLVAKEIFRYLNSGYHKPLKFKMSSYEIYRTKVTDLLSKNTHLQVLEDHNQEINVVGLTEKEVRKVSDVIKLLKIGCKTRVTAKTTANITSSRSHAIVTFKLYEDSIREPFGVYTLVDLAGNERAADTLMDSKQARKEGAYINGSLLALKTCIKPTSKKHIPYRESKLTLILRDSFASQQSKVCVIGTVNPGIDSSLHSLNTADYVTSFKKEIV